MQFMALNSMRALQDSPGGGNRLFPEAKRALQRRALRSERQAAKAVVSSLVEEFGEDEAAASAAELVAFYEAVATMRMIEVNGGVQLIAITAHVG